MGRRKRRKKEEMKKERRKENGKKNRRPGTNIQERLISLEEQFST
jgi:hypothetical protein